MSISQHDHPDACGCPGCIAHTQALNGDQEAQSQISTYGFRLFNSKWGESTRGTTGGTVTYSVDISDISPFRDLADPSEFVGIVTDAFLTWSSVANIDFVEVSEGGQLDVRTTTDGFSSDTTWGVPGGTLGRGGSGGRDGSNTSGIVWLDATEPFVTGGSNPFGSINFRLVLLHELGHALGLQHVSGEGRQLMNSRIGPEGLFGGDIAGVQTLYGAREWTDEAETILLKWVQVGQTVDAKGGNDLITATSKADIIYGGAGDDIIKAGGGNDRIYGGSGADRVEAGNGDDYVRVGGGVENFYGGNGHDYISYFNSKNGVTLNLETNVVSGSWAVNDTIEGFESASGSETGDDKITGSSDGNKIQTYGGNDRVFAGLGDDKVYLGDGNDYVRVGGGAESFYGGSGKDWLSYYDSSDGVTIDLATNSASGSWAADDVIESFESVSGSRTGDDSIIGTSGSNTIYTYGGDDRVAAGGGTDRIKLGSGDDFVRVGGGKETFDGGSGTDHISYVDSTNGIRIDLQRDEVSGSWAVNDTISNFERASGSSTGDDVMLGTSGSNLLYGVGGDDKLYGRGGSDELFGGEGDDFLDGGGGSGTDNLYGGTGADTFEFDRGEGFDVIKDFEDDVDQINLDNFHFSTEEAFGFADQVGSNVVFDFGVDGKLTIENTTIASLQNDLDVV